MDAEFRRVVDFEDAIRERCATRTERFRWGLALYNEDLPRVYDLNYLRADGDLADATAESLVAEADRRFDGAAHRQIEVRDPVAAERLEQGMREAGFEAFDALYMVLRRDPDRSAEPGTASQISWEELRPTKIEQLRREPFATSEEVVDQLTRRTEVEARATHLRPFAARVEGRPVSYCFLYSDGRTAQVEEVATLEEYRNRGLARATIETAVSVALAEDHEVVFIVADDDDWPKSLYARLGFDAVGKVTSFRRYPPLPAD